MVPHSAPPERHFGFQCINCRATNFMGRRYACWICIDYQICGICHDLDMLPSTPEHKHFHPLEVHYTRAEYDMYFFGEPYSEPNAPQSYKCAFCSSCGFTSLELYEHVTESHRDHKDFNEYHTILLTRYTADSSTGVAVSACPAATAAVASAAAYATRLAAASSIGVIDYNGDVIRTERERDMREFREVLRQSLERRNALIELQTNSMIEYRRERQDALNSSRDARMMLLGPRDQRQTRFTNGNLLYIRPVRICKSNRVCFASQGSRLRGGQSAQRPKEDNMNPYWASCNGEHGKRNRTDRKQSPSYADVARQSLENLLLKDEPKKPESSEFLCARFLSKEKEIKKMLPHDDARGRFTEALICSMLSEEHLTPKPDKTVVFGENIKPEDKLDEVLAADMATLSKPSDDAMDRFYRGLDNYSKWLADFTKAKNSKDDNISPLPNMIAREVQDAILTIDSDVDNDTDDNAETSDGNELPADESIEIATSDIADNDDGDEDGDGDVDDVVDEAGDEDSEEDGDEDADENGDEDGDEDGDEYEDEVGDEGGENMDEEGSDELFEVASHDGTGSETSDSTIAMLVNQIDEVYGSS